MMRSADAPKTRELTQRLLALEWAEESPCKDDVKAVSGVCEKLRRPLTTLAGAAGFRSLLTRALNLAKQEDPILGSVEVKLDGSLEGLTGESAQSGSVVIAHLIGLMITFIGEVLTLRLLHDAWPELSDSEVKLERCESK